MGRIWFSDASAHFDYTQVALDFFEGSRSGRLLRYDPATSQIEVMMDGKTIGSGRMEKVVDQAVAFRQKRKGMSWTEAGSRALTHLRTVELNGQWDEFWHQSLPRTV